jgi:hypothetical protein
MSPVKSLQWEHALLVACQNRTAETGSKNATYARERLNICRKLPVCLVEQHAKVVPS